MDRYEHYTVRGLVLSERTVGDWDKSLDLLCEGIGLVHAWARGAKRTNSPLLTASTLFSYGSYTLRMSESRTTIQQAETIEAFLPLRKSVQTLALASYVLELSKYFCAEEQQEDELLRLTLNTLYAVAQDTCSHVQIKACFELRALSITGYAPTLHACMSCGEETVAFFSFRKKGLLCASCVGSEEGAMQLDRATIAAMRYIDTAELSRIMSFSIGEKQCELLSAICERYALETIEHVPPTLNFYRQVKTNA